MSKYSLSMKTGLLIAVISIMATPAFSQNRSIPITLAGYNEHPPAPTSATGLVRISVKGDSLFVTGSFSNLTGVYSGAGVHYGDKNENGNQLFVLSATVNENRTGGTFKRSENKFKMTSGIIQALNEGLLYINIYTQLNPGGEIRGQIPALDN